MFYLTESRTRINLRPYQLPGTKLEAGQTEELKTETRREIMPEDTYFKSKSNFKSECREISNSNFYVGLSIVSEKIFHVSIIKLNTLAMVSKFVYTLHFDYWYRT